MLNIDGKLQTRCGLPVTILVKDLKGRKPLAGIVHKIIGVDKDEKEVVKQWSIDGKYLDNPELNHPYDLINVKQKKEGYIIFDVRQVIDNEKSGLTSLKYLDNKNLRCGKVEWFE